MTENGENQPELSWAWDHGEKSAVIIPITETIVDRIEKLAWEHDKSFEEVANACCRYGVIHYEDALSGD